MPRRHEFRTAVLLAAGLVALAAPGLGCRPIVVVVPVHQPLAEPAGEAAMRAALAEIDAHNRANAGTIGYKRLVPVIAPAEGLEGRRIAGLRRDMTSGARLQTGGEFDLMIDGDGFFQIEGDGGETVYTRAGQFAVSVDGEVIHYTDGLRRLVPSIVIPDDALSIAVNRSGTVLVQRAGATEPESVGQIELTRFRAPDALETSDGLIFRQGQAGGPIAGAPQDDAFGAILQGVLESSNATPGRDAGLPPLPR